MWWKSLLLDSGLWGTSVTAILRNTGNAGAVRVRCRLSDPKSPPLLHRLAASGSIHPQSPAASTALLSCLRQWNIFHQRLSSAFPFEYLELRMYVESKASAADVRIAIDIAR